MSARVRLAGFLVAVASVTVILAAGASSAVAAIGLASGLAGIGMAVARPYVIRNR